MLVHGFVKRSYDEVVEPTLALRDVRACAVAEGRARKSQLAFCVALVEELGIDGQRPHHVQVEWLRTVRDVAALQRKGCELLPLGEGVGVAGIEAAAEQLLAEAAQGLDVLGKVSLQNHLRNVSAEGGPQRRLQVSQEVRPARVKDREGDCAVHVLQGALVVVQPRQGRLGRDLVVVGEAVVADVVGGCSCQGSQPLDRLKVEKGSVLLAQEAEHIVHNIRTMHRVVIPVRLVASLNAVKEVAHPCALNVEPVNHLGERDASDNSKRAVACEA
mmetsp:Transcript_13128/g.37465  ORF Transcript_13128/g.37465 Transcript_13128/m.37465 type:complete len:273 (+) Transcript_13128:867-1685(+)